MDAVGRWIVVGGFLSVKTDQLGYFREFCEEVESIEAFSLEVKSEDWHNNPLSENSIRSEFECLFASKGQPICHALLRRGAI
jgi:tRNA G46 methylase TrmB